MAITDKTRKTLWARSGNRCAMCRTELVAERNEHSRNLNIGDECHIISEKFNGPRHVPDYRKNYDDYDNLILLCKNHHKSIDELWETYTIDLLKSFKVNHEKWIRDTIDDASKKTKENSYKILPRLTTGKQIIDIIKAGSVYQFDHDEFNTQEESDLVSDFLQNISDLGDLFSLSSFGIGEQTRLTYELNEEIEKIENNVFYIFGERRKARLRNANKEDLGLWEIATLVILRQNNPKIINAEKIIAHFEKV